MISHFLQKGKFETQKYTVIGQIDILFTAVNLCKSQLSWFFHLTTKLKVPEDAVKTW
jgi:hypothetical protein